MKRDLIITIVNHGYADMVMDAAKSKGARGGTIVNARGTANGIEKFFNISIQPEKEMILMVVDHEKRHEIMEEISIRAGLKTMSQGVSFSIPVNKAVGLFEDKED